MIKSSVIYKAFFFFFLSVLYRVCSLISNSVFTNVPDDITVVPLHFCGLVPPVPGVSGFSPTHVQRQHLVPPDLHRPLCHFHSIVVILPAAGPS